MLRATARRRRGLGSEGGQVLIFAALVFMTVLSVLTAGVADILVLLDGSARARSAAVVGATAGGQDVELIGLSGPLSGGASVPLRYDAVQVCQRQAGLADPRAQVSCQVSSGVVTATVTELVRFPIPMLGVSGQVSDVERAGPAVGTVSAG